MHSKYACGPPVGDLHETVADGRNLCAGREPVCVAQKDESLIEDMREQLRGDRERAARRAPALPQVEPVTEPVVEAAPEEPEPPRSTFGDRLRRVFSA